MPRFFFALQEAFASRNCRFWRGARQKEQEKQLVLNNKSNEIRKRSAMGLRHGIASARLTAARDSYRGPGHHGWSWRPSWLLVVES